MMELVRATWTVFGMQLRLASTSVRLLVCGLLAALPVGFSVFLTLVVPAREEAPIALLVWMMVAQGVCPLLALVFGSAVISEEVGDRTITYPFTRPIPRAALFLGRWLASLVVIAVLLALSTIGTLVILDGHFTNPEASGPLVETILATLQGVLMGAAVYSALFAALGVVIKQPMIVGLGYVFALEFLLVNAPLTGSLQHVALQFHLRSLVVGTGAEAYSDERLFPMNELVSSGDAWTTLAVLLGLALVVGIAQVSRKQYELSA